MQRIRLHHLVCMLGAVLLSGCGAGQLSDADQIATRVAQDRAVAATLTAVVVTSQPTALSLVVTPTAALAAPTSVALPTPSPQPVATNAPAPTIPNLPTAPAPTIPNPPTAPAPNAAASATPLPTQSIATATPALPSPTSQPVLAIFAPGGTANGLEGRIRVDGGSGYNPDTRVVPVTQFFTVRVEARDPQALQSEDAGILRVIFRVTEQQSGLFVYERTEERYPFCLFGDSNGICATVNLQPGARWPNGAPIVAGQHFIELEVQAENAERTEFWNFIADLALGQ